MHADYIELFGAKDGSKFAILIERRPKWLLLVLYLRKRYKMSFREAMTILKMNYHRFIRALRYLAGVSFNKKQVGYVTSLTSEPLVAIEALSYNEKYVVLTESGRRFAEKVISYLKSVALEYGKVDVEDELGIPKIAVMTELRKSLPTIKAEKYEDRIVSFDKLVANLSMVNPRLLAVIKPEVIDAYPIEIRTPSKKHVLYVIL